MTETTTLTSTSSRLWEVEGLRAVAAWSIVLFHVWIFSSPAVLDWNLGPLTAFVSPLQSGVTLFFVLSGFLLYRPIAAALLDATAAPPAWKYLRNRALRILPAYWVILFLVAFALRSASLGASGQGVLTGPLTNPKAFLLNVFLIQTYVPDGIWSGILPTWSLTIEVAFYLSLPLLALAATRFARGRAQSRRRIAAALGPVLFMLLLGLLGKTLVAVFTEGPQRATTSDWHGVLDRSILTHADLFGFGMGAALVLLLWERGLGERLKFLLWAGLARPLAYVGLPTIFLGYYLLPAYVYDAAVALLVSLLLARLLGPGERLESSTSPLRPFLTARWTVAAGRRSYSVFLWNYPLLVFLSTRHLLAGGNGAGAFLLNLAIAVPAIAILSALTYRFVEAPALRLKQRRRAHTTALPAATPAT
jgi:peptidoglycan/LPS O-acetylase OafA/YrhL